ncbi:MAG TPA: hypothetical protein VK929_07980 [Longimicrobiales bacterium]|nr:hypothetical protein [Longimicrobiales bacterium]
MRVPDIPSSAFPLRLSVRRRPDGSEVRIVAHTGTEWTAGELAASSDVDALGAAATAVASLDEQVRLLNAKHAALGALAEDTLPGGRFRAVARFLSRFGGSLAVGSGVFGLGLLAVSPAGPGIGVAAAGFAMVALLTGERPVSGRRAEFNIWSTILGGLTLGTGFAASPGLGLTLGLAATWTLLAATLAWRCRRLGRHSLPALVERVARRLSRPLAAEPTVDLVHDVDARPRWRIGFRDVRGHQHACEVSDAGAVQHLVAAANVALGSEAERLLEPADADVMHGTLLKVVATPAPTLPQRIAGLFRRRT